MSRSLGGPSDFPQNLHLRFEVEVAGCVSKLISNSEVSCDHCIDGRNGPAVVFCCTCRQFLCKHCEDHHRSGRQLSKHDIVGLDQEGAKHLLAIMKPREHYCTQPNHEDKKLNFYCETCQCLVQTCGDCMPVAHKGHSITITELSTIAKNQRSAIGEVLSNARETVARVTGAIDVNNKVREQVMLSKMDVHLAIDQAFEALQNALEMRKTTLLSELESISLSKTTALTLQKEMFDKVIEEIGYYIEIAVHSLQTHTDHEIIALRGLIPSELSSVLKKVEPILIPNTHNGVSAVVPTDDLIKALSKFGNILDLSAPSPSSSTWTSTSVAKVKTDFLVKVESKTSKGTVCPHGGLQMKAEMRSKTGAVVQGDVEDHGDGTYTTTLIPLTAGSHQLLITLDGQHVMNSPHDLNVLHKYDHNTLGHVQQVIKCPSAPYCVAVSDNEDLYIGAYEDCIYVFNAAGHLEKTIGCRGNSGGQFDYPFSMVIEENTLLVADKGNNCIKRLTLEGTFINQLSATGAAGVLVDNNKRIFVSDCLDNKIYAFNPDGVNTVTINGSVTGFGSASNRHLLSAISKFNALVSPTEAITVESVLSSPLSQHALWLGLHLDPAEFQIAVMWWLGMNSSIQSVCPFCPNITLDPLGHHAVSCRHGGDVAIRHNRLRNIFAEFCRRAHLSVRVEVGQGLSRVQSNSRPADVLVDAWDRAKPAAFDVTVTSPLTPATLHDACNSAGVVTHKAECRKHSSNDPKCQELGWVCVPLAVESFGNWGKEAQNTFARLASILSISLHCPKAKVLTEIYGRLNISLRGGCHEKLQPIDFLCNLWANNDLTCLWNLAKGQANKLRDAPAKNQNTPGKPVDMAVSFGRCGMLGKACRTLLSSGIAPNNDTTWLLLKAKNLASEIPIIPSVRSGSISLDSSFDIGAVLRSFPKNTAAGPSGLHIQHLLDIISVPLQTPITSSLIEVVNLLVSGKAPQAVSKLMAGGRLIALSKNKEGSPPDIRPIIVGESLRRLAGE
eukprot:Em0003g1197a